LSICKIFKPVGESLNHAIYAVPVVAILWELLQQATEAGMIVNGRKPNEMLIGQIHKDPAPKYLTLHGVPV